MKCPFCPLEIIFVYPDPYNPFLKEDMWICKNGHLRFYYFTPEPGLNKPLFIYFVDKFTIYHYYADPHFYGISTSSDLKILKIPFFEIIDYNQTLKKLKTIMVFA